MSRFLSPIIIFVLLAACAPSSADVTATSVMTITSAPSPFPTATETPTSTPEPQPMPENLPGGPVVQETMKNLKPEDYKIEGNTIFVNWSGQKEENGNPKWEEAFVKNGENWEVRKFYLKREKPDISSMTCKKIEDKTRQVDASCMQQNPKSNNTFHLKFMPGDLVWEARRDENGNILPGSIIYTYAHTRREPGTPEEVIKIALQVDEGDGKDQTSFRAQKPAISISEIDSVYPISNDVTFVFLINENDSGMSQRNYLQGLKNYTDQYLQYYQGVYIDSNLIFYPYGKISGSYY